MSLTLVAYYGAKPDPLKRLLTALIDALDDEIGDAFESYELEQIHATVIGLEAVRDGGKWINRRYFQHLAQHRAADFAAALGLLQDPGLLPIEVTVGGYNADRSYPFASRGESPYARSFSFQGARAVTMGWPFARGVSTPALDRLRRRFNDANILHKYHDSQDAVDNDLYFVLGRIRLERVGEGDRVRAQHALRELMAGREATRISLAQESLSVVVYEDESLPLATSRRYGVVEACNRLDEIQKLIAKD